MQTVVAHTGVSRRLTTRLQYPSRQRCPAAPATNAASYLQVAIVLLLIMLILLLPPEATQPALHKPYAISRHRRSHCPAPHHRCAVACHHELASGHGHRPSCKGTAHSMQMMSRAYASCFACRSVLVVHAALHLVTRHTRWQVTKKTHNFRPRAACLPHYSRILLAALSYHGYTCLHLYHHAMASRRSSIRR
jgi:hypothetical protein